jgi:hypothetical protein
MVINESEDRGPIRPAGVSHLMHSVNGIGFGVLQPMCDTGSREMHGDDMEEDIPPFGPIDLESLDRYLVSDHAPNNSMGLSDLDGFLTGIAIGPELIPPSEWLPVIWGDEEPEFVSEAELRSVLGTSMGRYIEITTCFGSDPSECEPIF